MSTDDLTNGVISYCFLAVFQDMIRLFACYNDGIINLLGNDVTLLSQKRFYAFTVFIHWTHSVFALSI